MLVCNVVQVCALRNISVGTNFSFVMCSPGRETSSIYGHLEGVQQLHRYLLGSEKVGRFYVCTTRILTYFASVIVTVVFKKGNILVPMHFNANVCVYVDIFLWNFYFLLVIMKLLLSTK